MCVYSVKQCHSIHTANTHETIGAVCDDVAEIWYVAPPSRWSAMALMIYPINAISSPHHPSCGIWMVFCASYYFLLYLIHISCSKTPAKLTKLEGDSDTSHWYAALCCNSCRREIKNGSSVSDFCAGNCLYRHGLKVVVPWQMKIKALGWKFCGIHLQVNSFLPLEFTINSCRKWSSQQIFGQKVT